MSLTQPTLCCNGADELAKQPVLAAFFTLHARTFLPGVPLPALGLRFADRI